ncbi:hypothetical protein [Actinoplanes sp. NPDC051411]
MKPTTHAGNSPLGTAGPGGPAVPGGLAIVLVLAAFVAFRRRDLPQR